MTLPSRYYTEPPYIARKTVTFTGASGLGAVGAVPLFTVTGAIHIENIAGRCTTDLHPAIAGATIALGVTGATTLFIGATTADSLDAATTSLWVSTTPTAGGIAETTSTKEMFIGADIIATVATQAIDAGVLEVYVVWRPMSLNALVT